MGKDPCRMLCFLSKDLLAVLSQSIENALWKVGPLEGSVLKP